MNKSKNLVGLSLTLIISILISKQAKANCADSVASLEVSQPAIQRIWQQLQQRKDYPWGKVRPYQKLAGYRITLSPEFDTLSGSQKSQVLELLNLDYNNNNYFKFLTPEEQEKALKGITPGIGAIPPHQVFTSDDRLLSIPYDGCTRLQLLTEYNRYQISFYGREKLTRINRFPLAANQEAAIKKLFWNTVGYRQNDLQWIAWVPETGYFEINVFNNAKNRYQQRLQRFWNIAPRQYRYIVVAEDGTKLLERNFK